MVLVTTMVMSAPMATTMVADTVIAIIMLASTVVAKARCMSRIWEMPTLVVTVGAIPMYIHLVMVHTMPIAVSMGIVGP